MHYLIRVSKRTVDYADDDRYFPVRQKVNKQLVRSKVTANAATKIKFSSITIKSSSIYDII